MLAAKLTQPDADNPLDAVVLGDTPEPEPDSGWTVVSLKASALNHHDIWSMRGAGVNPAWLPCTLGSDGAGIDADGNEVIIYNLIADAAEGWGDQTLDPGRRMISDGIDGTLAEQIAIPKANLVAKPTEMSWATAASLPTSWLTAYRMLFVTADLPAGATVLVQGAGGGLSTALITLGRAAGLRVWTTSRDEAKRDRAVSVLGADAAFASGEKLPERVDAVMESVGEATWSHSLRSLRPGGKLVVAGATTGAAVNPELGRVFLNQIQILGCALGTIHELRRLVTLCDSHDIEPVIDSTHRLADVHAGISRMLGGDLFGKVIITPA